MGSVVLDASAVLAFLTREPGADEIATVVGGGSISTVNLSEVVAKLSEGGLSLDEARDSLNSLGLDVVAFDVEDAYAAGALRPATRAAGLSLGDRACLALAAARGATAWTTDAEWKRLDLDVDVHLVVRRRGD